MTSASKANGNAHHVAPLDASLLTIELAETLKPIPAAGTYTFGDVHTDHMLIMTYHPLTGWSAPQIKPYGPIPIDPSSNCLQYASNVFEGMKAVLDPEGKPRLFRPKANMQRLLSSAARMALPAFDPDALLTCITKLVGIESRWIPSLPDHSLYIRPTMIGTKASIKVSASDHATLYTIVTPVGPYFAPSPNSTSPGVSLLAVGEHVRSWPGGTGGFKLGLNYSPGFVPQQAAAKMGYDQVLWLLGEDKRVTEAGAMNFFAVSKRDDGGLTIVTPPLDGTILPGITRDSTLVLLRAHAADPSLGLLNLPAETALHIEERILTVGELTAWAAAGKLVECFGTGTAVLVVAIERIGDIIVEAAQTVPVLEAAAHAPAIEAAANGAVIEAAMAGAGKSANVKVDGKPAIRDIEMSAGRGLGPMGQALWDKLLALKEGREEFAGWNVLCE